MQVDSDGINSHKPSKDQEEVQLRLQYQNPPSNNNKSSNSEEDLIINNNNMISIKTARIAFSRMGRTAWETLNRVT